MIYLLLVIVLQWAAVGILLHDARRERDRNAVVLADFAKAAERERQMLLQRIQAPEAAVLQHEQDTRPPAQDAPWLGWETDDLEQRLTKEQLAEAIDGSND
jgi:hypothetical protein